MRRFAMIGLLALTASTLLAAPATTPSSRPTTRAASRPVRAEDPIRVAITALQREAQEAARRGPAFPRTESDYFASQSAGTAAPIAPAELLKAVTRRISPDPRVDAYVKWQLLSGVTGFDGTLVKDAIAAYVNAAPLIPLPGLTAQERQRWVQLAQRVETEAQSDELEAKWEAERSPYVEANAIVITYRDAIRAKITATDDLRPRVLQAHFEDLSQRAAAGLDVDKELTAWIGETRAWATLAKRPALADMATFVREYTRRQGPAINDNLVWYDSRKSASWRTRKAQLDEKKLATLVEQLAAMAQQSPR